jgi:predicted RND superfamily exporter protein
MKKIVKLTETDLTNLIKRIHEEVESIEDVTDNTFSVEPSVRKIPREKELQSMFGKYDTQIPNDVLRYMRKNPQLLMNRLAKIYGDNFLKYADKAYMNTKKFDDLGSL